MMTGMQTHKQGPAWDYLQKWGYLKKRVSMGATFAVAIQEDGTARISNNRCNVDCWNNLKEIVGLTLSSVGLRNDGEVYFSGNILGGEEACQGTPISSWPKNIKSISGAISVNEHILGLTEDGRVIAYGHNNCGQCNTSAWCNIVEIKTAWNLSVGLCQDGTVVLCGNSDFAHKVSFWRNVEHIYAAPGVVIGLQTDGKVLVASKEPIFDTSDWRDIIDISCVSDRIA